MQPVGILNIFMNIAALSAQLYGTDNTYMLLHANTIRLRIASYIQALHVFVVFTVSPYKY